MARYIFDLESNGLLPDLTKIHCLALLDMDTGEVLRFRGKGIIDGVKLLQAADLIVGHNVIKFDIPAIMKIFPWFIPSMKVRDTLVLTRFLWADIAIKDITAKRYTIPRKLVGSHSLEAWGHRLGEYKGDFKGPWDTWTQEMDDYCAQDIEVTFKLWKRIVKEKPAPRASELEHQVAWIIARQEAEGVPFDVNKAADLYSILASRRESIKNDLKKIHVGWNETTVFVPKVNNKARGYVKGQPTTKTRFIEFNPSSRHHIARLLKERYGWVSPETTEKGQPKIDDTTLATLDAPEAALFCEFFLIEKRIGAVAEGAQAWLKTVQVNGRIHGGVITNGAVTGRATHQRPNLAQVPSCGAPFGKECRELFYAPEGWSMVGVDVSGLELRCLAHYMFKFDHGEYAKILLEGDIHTANQIAAGLATRAQAKTFIYAFLYGAGDPKIGLIIGKDAAAGKKIKARFFRKVPALAALVSEVREQARLGYLIGLDGRRLNVRSSHAALNTLLQSAGALICKQWLVEFHKLLQERNLAQHVRQVLWVHDEIQLLVRNGFEQDVGTAAVEAVRLAGNFFGIRLRLDGEFKVGRNWAETH